MVSGPRRYDRNPERDPIPPELLDTTTVAMRRETAGIGARGGVRRPWCRTTSSGPAESPGATGSARAAREVESGLDAGEIQIDAAPASADD